MIEELGHEKFQVCQVRREVNFINNHLSQILP
jgi:hypothetical protein